MSIDEQACGEVAKYRIEPQIDLDGKLLHWWRDHKSIYPTLCKLVRKALCIVATSVPLESLCGVNKAFYSVFVIQWFYIKINYLPINRLINWL